MASLKLEHIYKVYPNGTKAVNDISLDIENGEFIVFVGPSGCGKSTTLRMIAGLEEITAGELYIDNNIVNDVEPKDRDIAMVFQNYALYPHMTVYENMAFGLKLRHVPTDVIQEKVLWAADILGIKDYLDRKPRNMSGGQRQRVALGRAILRDPKVMLLDEPLSNLDAKLRTQMRTEIAKLHKKLQTTFIYVTHDQTEAMTLGDRVVVMKKGLIQQVDTPKNLYSYPDNKFVAGFIGTPQMNFFDVTLERKDETVLVNFKDNGATLKVDYNQLIKVQPEFLDGKHDIILGIRCESISVAEKASKDTLQVKISHFEELGSECLIYGSIILDDDSVESKTGQIIVKVKEVENLEAGQIINVKFDMKKTYFFDKVTEDTIVPRIPAYNSFAATIKDNKLLFLNNELALPKILQSKDVESLQLKVPVNAVKLNEKGFKAKIEEIEVINKKTLVHLSSGGRIFFALTDETSVKVGQEIDVNFDFTLLTAISSDNSVLFEPIQEFDAFKASFYNYQSVIAKVDNPEFVKFRDDKIKAASDYMDAKIILENQNYDKKKLELDNTNLEELKNNSQKAYEELLAKNTALINETNEANKTELRTLKEQYNADCKDAKSKNEEIFKAKKMQEEREFHEFKLNNSDPEALKRRTDEYHIFKDNYYTDKENALNRKLNTLSMDYETKVSSLKASRRRTVDLYKKEIKEAKKKLNVDSAPYKYLLAEHNKALSALEKEKKESVLRAGYVFFLQFANDYFNLCTDIISNKLIQGLSTRVFSKEFRVDVPHDAYSLNEKGEGVKVVVEDTLDYGGVYFIKCSYTDANINKVMFLKSDKTYKKNTVLNLTFDISRCQITETGMNIRLY